MAWAALRQVAASRAATSRVYPNSGAEGKAHRCTFPLLDFVN